jgi:MerR family redox-sensitive transcriptional activator SoxR
MTGIPIGRIARMSGLAPSAIRYYEKAGLLPRPARQGGQRRYDLEDLGRLHIVQVARAAGFTIAETRAFLTGFSTATTPAARWRVLAAGKLAEIDEQMKRIMRMKAVLEASFRCECPRLEDCGRIIAANHMPG